MLWLQVLLGSATDVWILSRLSHLVETCDIAFKSHSLNQATQALHLFWQQDFCDLYVVSVLFIIYSGGGTVTL